MRGRVSAADLLERGTERLGFVIRDRVDAGRYPERGRSAVGGAVDVPMALECRGEDREDARQDRLTTLAARVSPRRSPGRRRRPG